KASGLTSLKAGTTTSSTESNSAAHRTEAARVAPISRASAYTLPPTSPYRGTLTNRTKASLCHGRSALRNTRSPLLGYVLVWTSGVNWLLIHSEPDWIQRPRLGIVKAR